MRIVAVPDSFKGCLSAVEAADAIEKGARLACPDAEVIKVPMADGGEGTVDALVMAAGGRRVACRALDPLGREIESFYGLIDEGRTAVIEMAAASGLPLLQKDELNPLKASTYGTGQLIAHALDRGVERIIIGIGGSATNDGGLGMAKALGARFSGENGEAGEGGGALAAVTAVDVSALHPRLREVAIEAACDVTNPLCGPKGASAVFGPQKGADEAMIKQLDAGLAHYASILKRDLGRDIENVPGSGAAGGLGGGLMAFLNARLLPGIDIITGAAGLAEKIQSADLVITGEGRTDEQTLYGKVPSGVAKLAHGVPVVCLSGGLLEGYQALYQHGVTAVFSIAQRPVTLEEAMEHSAEWLAQCTQAIVRLMNR
ncbi:glycerate kinase [Gehongia tenuis]|uniref:Glycerate kinase n=1 Tax=Gehongia tenuis TaxID=2763655 RepID=A0A926D663_9FIRM|nr:glycerate kinase [Gehongia tenuis]MBC8532381.1 glycerate kinase [Gehongia tenuis]